MAKGRVITLVDITSARRMMRALSFNPALPCFADAVLERLSAGKT